MSIIFGDADFSEIPFSELPNTDVLGNSISDIIFGDSPFASITFSDLIWNLDFPVKHIVGSFGAKRKEKKHQYEIFGRYYYLTKREYADYLKSRKKFEKSIKNKTNEELFDIVLEEIPTKGKTTSTSLKELLIKPVFETRELVSIPFIDFSLADKFEAIARERLNKIANDIKIKETKLKREQDDIIALLFLL